VVRYRRPVRTGRPSARPERDRCTTPDGLGIEIYDFGGTGADLLMVHATGFCAEVFTPMAGVLGDRFRCWALDLRAHGRSDRPADGNLAWTGFARDVLAVIDHLGLNAPFGFGHSCGGASVLLAEEQVPGTFGSLYCFEPVLFPDSPDPGRIADNPLSAGARRRRQTFASADEALANFSSKPPFGDFDPAVLAAYVDGGFELIPVEESGDGRAIRLRCTREDEAATYEEGLTHPTFRHLGEVGCPVTLACGELTDSFGPDLLRADALALPDARVEVLPGIGHFGPLQRPDVVAGSIVAALHSDPGTPRS
jgi:pimeloyl-ACP methyl ester carboxylesterase